MNVLFVCENYAPHIGGVEIVFKTLAEGLVKLGHRVNVVTHRLKNTLAHEVINGVHVRRVRSFDSRYVFTFSCLSRVLMLSRNADIIHTTTFNGAPPAWLASRIFRKKCIITVHEVWANKWRELTDKSAVNAAIHNTLEKLIYLLPFDHYACVSQYTHQALLEIGISTNKSSVVYNGVQYEHFHENVTPLEKLDGFVFLCYGRPGPSKGIEIAVRAFAAVKGKLPDARLFLMLSRDSAYQRRYISIKQLVQELGIQNRVVFREPILWGKLPGFLKSVNCVVIPSFAEGFCFAAAEAAAVKTNLVATTAGSLPEVVSGSVILVPSRDVTALSHGLVDAYYGNYSYVPEKRFTVKENVEKYVALYHSLCRVEL